MQQERWVIGNYTQMPHADTDFLITITQLSEKITNFFILKFNLFSKLLVGGMVSSSVEGKENLDIFHFSTSLTYIL